MFQQQKKILWQCPLLAGSDYHIAFSKRLKFFKPANICDYLTANSNTFGHG
jgi:hypothetical protein